MEVVEVDKKAVQIMSKGAQHLLVPRVTGNLEEMLTEQLKYGVCRLPCKNKEKQSHHIGITGFLKNQYQNVMMQCRKLRISLPCHHNAMCPV